MITNIQIQKEKLTGMIQIKATRKFIYANFYKLDETSTIPKWTICKYSKFDIRAFECIYRNMALYCDCFGAQENYIAYVYGDGGGGIAIRSVAGGPMVSVLGFTLNNAEIGALLALIDSD